MVVINPGSPGSFFIPQNMFQRISTILNDVEGLRQMTVLQQEIPMKNTEVEIDLIRQQPTMGAAISMSAAIAGLVPKQVYSALGIDKATWSKVQSDQAALSGDRLERLANLTGNEIPMIWWADRRGYNLEPKETELERRLREANERAVAAEQKAAILEDVLRSK